MDQHQLNLESSAVCEQQLKMIYTHLNIHATNVCTFPNFDSNGMQEEILTHCLIVRSIIKHELNLTSTHRKYLSKIHTLTKLLSGMIQERSNILRITKQTSPKELTCESSGSLKFDVLTPDIITRTRLKKVSRIPRNSVKVLETWYTANYQYPYPDRQAVDSIILETGLEELQIRNWYVTKLVHLRALKLEFLY